MAQNRWAIDFALRLAPREFRDGYRRNFGYSGNPLNVAWVGVALRFESVARDAVFAMRSLGKARMFTAIAVMTLALAVSVNATVFGTISATLLRPLPFAAPQQLVFLISPQEQTPNHIAAVYQRESRTLASIAAWQYMSAALTGFGPPRSVNIAWVSSNFFDVLRARPELGRTFDSHDAQTGVRNVVISDALWKTQFRGTANVIGRALKLDGATWRIIGVARRDVTVPDMEEAPGLNQYDIFEALPASSFNGPHPFLNDWTFARVAPGVSMGAVQQDLNRITSSLVAAHPLELKGFDLKAVPFTSFYYSSARRLLYLALAAVFAVLLIACANIANLLLVRGMARTGELVTRSALGAAHGRILQQLVIEIFILACAGGLIGLLLARGEMILLAALNPSTLPGVTQVHIDGMVVACTFGVVVLATILGGIAPATIVIRRDLQSRLKGAGRNADASTGNALRVVLATAEIALAFAVILASGLLYRSFLTLSSAELGFNPAHVYVATTELFSHRFAQDAARAQFIDNVQKRIAEIPGVNAVAAGRPVPSTSMGGEGFTYRLAGRTYVAGSEPAVVKTQVTPDYFKTLSIPLLQGREFNGSDGAAAPPVAIVERAFARQAFPGQSALGKRILLQGRDGWTPVTIVGLVGDVNQFGHFGDAATMYVPAAQWPPMVAQLVIRTNGAVSNLSDSISRAVAAVDPLEAVQGFRSLQSSVDRHIAPARTSAALVGVLAAIALLLALAGIYAIVSYSVEQRRHEFGIRLAIGAHSREVLRIVLSGALRLGFWGVLFGLVLAAFGARLIGGMLTDVAAFDPVTLAGAIAVLFISVTAASAVPAIQAAQLDPAVALRYE